MKIWLCALALSVAGCHDASKDLQKLAETCDACDKDPKATPEAKKASVPVKRSAKPAAKRDAR